MRGFKVLHPRFIDQFEHDARTQARFHLVMAWFWLFTMVAAPAAFWPHNLQELIQLLILEVSLYANFATEFGALSGSQASEKADRIDVHGNEEVNIMELK
jgi:hypothetical protein